jgi:hypothetical protein
MSLKPSKERRFSDIIPSITQKLLKKPKEPVFLQKTTINVSEF